MGFLDSLKNLTRPYDDEDEFYDDDTELETDIRPIGGQPAAPAGEKKGSFFSASAPEYEQPAPRTAYPPKKEKSGGKVMNISHSGTKIVFMKPERYETSKEICDHIQAGRTVVLSLDSTNKETARRILDFTAGAASALNGRITRVSSNTYLITPYGVDIVGGDLMEELENSGFFF